VSLDLEAAQAAARARIEPRLERLLVGGAPSLLAAMRYAVLNGGKRVRPMVCLWSHALFAGDEDEAILDAACGLEFVHAYSLVHDDLPCMDDDELRRGQPTVHVRFGEALAVLAGDALLNRAYEVVAAAAWRRPERGLAVLRTLADAASHRELLAGQVMDLEAEGVPPDAAVLEAIHAAKTSALFTAALVIGGQAAGAGDAEVEPLRCAGRHLGLAFQHADDVLDVTGGHGKHTGHDARAAKLTSTAVHGIEGARARAREHARAAADLFAAWPHSESLQALAWACARRAG
jgi:geranylgeranyl pyrophosphate synthase